MVVGSELREENGAHDGSNLSLTMLQGRGVALAAASVLPGVEVLVPADELINVLRRLAEDAREDKKSSITDSYYRNVYEYGIHLCKPHNN